VPARVVQGGLFSEHVSHGFHENLARMGCTERTRSRGNGEISPSVWRANRSKTNAALSAIEGQRRTRAGLVDEIPWRPAPLATLATVAAKGRQIETGAAPPIR
jgi:hypothetical protein